MISINNISDFPKPKRNGAAGIAILWQGSILLVHPTNASWQRATLGIPKGGIEDGESEMDAAIRETLEETGIKIRPEQLDPSPERIELYRGKKHFGFLVYFVCRINSPEEIGLDGDRVPKQQLQQTEIDWAGFLPIEQAYGKIIPAQLIILDRARV